MRRKYRSVAGIILDILKCVEEGCETVTCVATCANLPYDRAKSIVERLVEKGYLEKGDVLVVTEEGKKAMEKLLEAKELLEALGYKL